MRDNDPMGRFMRSDWTRRDALRAVAAGAVTLSGGSLLAACGGHDSDSGSGSGSTDEAAGGLQLPEGAKTGKVHNLVLLTNEFNTVMSDSAERAAAFLGLEYSESVFDADESVALRQAEEAIAAGADMLFVQGATGAGIPALARLCAKNDVFFSNMWTQPAWYTPFPTAPNFVWWFTGADDVNFYESVKAMLTKVEQEKGENAKIIYVTGLPGGSIDTQRQIAARKALSEFPKMELMGSLPGQWSAEGGQKATEDLVSRHGKPDGVISQNDGALTGVLAALNGLGMKPGQDVFCCGADGAGDILKAIQAGAVVSTAYTSPAYFGVVSVVRVYDGLNGFDFTPPERQMDLIGITATEENIDGIVQRYVDNDKLPFDPRLMSRTVAGDDWDPMIELRPINMETFWGGIEAEQPKGYELAPEYVEALDSGQLDEIADLYAQQYKIKADDYEYMGVDA